VRFIASGPPDSIRVEVDTAPLAQFLTQRALELEQQRVEAMQAALTEKQRLRREVRYYAALDAERAAAAEAARRAAEEAARLERERIERDRQEQLRREEETERRRLEDEARRAGEEARRQAEEQAAREREADEDARLRAEVEALLRARAPETPALTPQSPDVTPMPAPRDTQAGDAPPVLDGASVSDFLKAIGADR
jgi:hypothetical protein